MISVPKHCYFPFILVCSFLVTREKVGIVLRKGARDDARVSTTYLRAFPIPEPSCKLFQKHPRLLRLRFLCRLLAFFAQATFYYTTQLLPLKQIEHQLLWFGKPRVAWIVEITAVLIPFFRAMVCSKSDSALNNLQTNHRIFVNDWII